MIGQMEMVASLLKKLYLPAIKETFEKSNALLSFFNGCRVQWTRGPLNTAWIPNIGRCCRD